MHSITSITAEQQAFKHQQQCRAGRKRVSRENQVKMKNFEENAEHIVFKQFD